MQVPYLSLAGLWRFKTLLIYTTEPFSVTEPWEITLEGTSSRSSREAKSNSDV